MKFYADYLRLVQIDGFVKLYNDLKNDFNRFFHFYRRIKKEQLFQQDITNLIKGQQELKFLENRVEFYIQNIQRQQLQGKQLEQVIDGFKSR